MEMYKTIKQLHKDIEATKANIELDEQAIEKYERAAGNQTVESYLSENEDWEGIDQYKELQTQHLYLTNRLSILEKLEDIAYIEAVEILIDDQGHDKQHYIDIINYLRTLSFGITQDIADRMINIIEGMEG